jgi:Bacterial PH domain
MCVGIAACDRKCDRRVALVLLMPFVIVVIAALAAIVSVRCSSLAITRDGVEVRNYPQAPKLVPLSQVDRFEEAARVGNFSSLRPATAVLVLTDGSRLPVRRIEARDAGNGVEALNARLSELRRI